MLQGMYLFLLTTCSHITAYTMAMDQMNPNSPLSTVLIPDSPPSSLSWFITEHLQWYLKCVSIVFLDKRKFNSTGKNVWSITIVVQCTFLLSPCLFSEAELWNICLTYKVSFAEEESVKESEMDFNIASWVSLFFILNTNNLLMVGVNVSHVSTTTVQGKTAQANLELNLYNRQKATSVWVTLAVTA